MADWMVCWSVDGSVAQQALLMVVRWVQSTDLSRVVRRVALWARATDGPMAYMLVLVSVAAMAELLAERWVFERVEK